MPYIFHIIEFAVFFYLEHQTLCNFRRMSGSWSVLAPGERHCFDHEYLCKCAQGAPFHFFIFLLVETVWQHDFALPHSAFHWLVVSVHPLLSFAILQGASRSHSGLGGTIQGWPIREEGVANGFSFSSAVDKTWLGGGFKHFLWVGSTANKTWEVQVGPRSDVSVGEFERGCLSYRRRQAMDPSFGGWGGEDGALDGHSDMGMGRNGMKGWKLVLLVHDAHDSCEN